MSTVADNFPVLLLIGCGKAKASVVTSLSWSKRLGASLGGNGARYLLLGLMLAPLGDDGAAGGKAGNSVLAAKAAVKSGVLL